jgi:hypothetical protein
MMAAHSIMMLSVPPVSPAIMLGRLGRCIFVSLARVLRCMCIWWVVPSSAVMMLWCGRCTWRGCFNVSWCGRLSRWWWNYWHSINGWGYSTISTRWESWHHIHRWSTVQHLLPHLEYLFLLLNCYFSLLFCQWVESTVVSNLWQLIRIVHWNSDTTRWVILSTVMYLRIKLKWIPHWFRLLAKTLTFNCLLVWLCHGFQFFLSNIYFNFLLTVFNFKECFISSLLIRYNYSIHNIRLV